MIHNIDMIFGNEDDLTPRFDDGVRAKILTQSVLGEVLSLEKEISRLMILREDLRQEIEIRFRNGWSVEYGPLTTYIETKPGRKSVSWKKVVIRLKGEGYCSQVLSSTKEGPDTERLVIE